MHHLHWTSIRENYFGKWVIVAAGEGLLLPSGRSKTPKLETPHLCRLHLHPRTHQRFHFHFHRRRVHHGGGFPKVKTSLKIKS